ncbi:hypothetical protein HVE01_24790 [Vreelandella venusta]|nr:hypothetical protein HVE01_24790 [Halomonas venusta]
MTTYSELYKTYSANYLLSITRQSVAERHYAYVLAVRLMANATWDRCSSSYPRNICQWHRPLAIKDDPLLWPLIDG